METIPIIETEIRLLQMAIKEQLRVRREYPRIETARQLIKLMEKDIQKLEVKKRLILDRVNSLPVDTQRKIAFCIVVKGMTFEETAEAMHYHVRTVFRYWEKIKPYFVEGDEDQCPD